MIEEQDVYRITIPYAGITDNNGQETDKKPTRTDMKPAMNGKYWNY